MTRVIDEMTEDELGLQTHNYNHMVNIEDAKKIGAFIQQDNTAYQASETSLMRILDDDAFPRR